MFFVFLIKKQVQQRLEPVLKYSIDFIHNGFILDGFAKKILIPKFFDDVKLNSFWFSKVEIAINDIRKVGKIKSKFLFISIKPLLIFLKIIPYFFKINSKVVQEKPADLS